MELLPNFYLALESNLSTRFGKLAETPHRLEFSKLAITSHGCLWGCTHHGIGHKNGSTVKANPEELLNALKQLDREILDLVGEDEAAAFKEKINATTVDIDKHCIP